MHPHSPSPASFRSNNQVGPTRRAWMRGTAPAGLRGRPVGVAKERCDYIGRFLASNSRDSLESLRVFTLDREQDAKLRVRGPAVGLDVLRVDRREILVKITGLRFEGCPWGVAHWLPVDDLTLDLRRLPTRHDEPR